MGRLQRRGKQGGLGFFFAVRHPAQRARLKRVCQKQRAQERWPREMRSRSEQVFGWGRGRRKEGREKSVGITDKKRPFGGALFVSSLRGLPFFKESFHVLDDTICFFHDFLCIAAQDREVPRRHFSEVRPGLYVQGLSHFNTCTAGFF